MPAVTAGAVPVLSVPWLVTFTFDTAKYLLSFMHELTDNRGSASGCV